MSSKPIASYPYIGLSKGLLATKHRYEPKNFRWTVPLAGGGEGFRLSDANLSQRDLPIYRLYDVLDAPVDALIFWVEGEKDADNLAALGAVATCSSEGANANVEKWPVAKLVPLQGRDVVILPDNDDVGRTHAVNVARELRSVAKSVRILELPKLKEKGDVSDWIEQGGTLSQLLDLARNTRPLTYGEPRPELRSGAVLADEVRQTIKRFVVLGEHETVALSLWTLHTHAFESSEQFTPYIAIHSPTRAAGKTTLVDVLFHLVAEPSRADSATAAVIYRKVDRGRGQGKPSGRPPTLFLDELDAVFSGGSAKNERAEALRGVLNSGFKRDGIFSVCDGDNNEPRDFYTWSPKVLAGIGKLPDTVSDRSIPIALARATREELERIAPARHRALSKLSGLRDELAAWAERAAPLLESREEPIAEGLSARQADIWGPLLNIADLIGGEWPTLAREAARALHEEKGDTTDGRDAGTALLADLRELFYADGIEREVILSGFLAESLRTMDDRPWPEYTRGGPISTHAIARLLRAYNISPRLSRTIGADGKRQRGYYLDDCREAFRRYLPPRSGDKCSSAHEEAEAPVSQRAAAMNTSSHDSIPASLPAFSEVFKEETIALTAGGYPADWG